MTTPVLSSPTATEALERVSELLDLSDVRAKLTDPEEGKDYGPAQLDLMESEYRKFLALHLAYPEADVVPCGIVDEMWHQHILDTMAYAADCEAIFGRFLHHFPYFGMRGEDDARALESAYSDTLERYQDCFGAPPADTWISADASKCRTQCKPMKCR
jgi:hypothetical protein